MDNGSLGNASNGSATYLITDVESSAPPGSRSAGAPEAVLARQGALFLTVVTAHGGYGFMAVGDGFCAAFTDASEAVVAALEFQRRLPTATSDAIQASQVRMALHTVKRHERNDAVPASPPKHLALLLRAGHGGQILLSYATHQLIRDTPPRGTTLINLGALHRDTLNRSELVFQIKEQHSPHAQRDSAEEPVATVADVDKELDEVQERLNAELRARRPDLFDADGEPREGALERVVEERTGKTRLSRADIVDLFRKKSS